MGRRKTYKCSEYVDCPVINGHKASILSLVNSGYLVAYCRASDKNKQIEGYDSKREMDYFVSDWTGEQKFKMEEPDWLDMMKQLAYGSAVVGADYKYWKQNLQDRR